jgi:hypothetical protein
MKVPGGIEAFTIAGVEGLGGAAEKQADGLYTVLWTEGNAAEPEAHQLAFDPEALEDDPEAELVTVASPTLERIIAHATAMGRASRAFLNVVPGNPKAVRESLARSYRFIESSWTPGEGRPWFFPSGIFLFRIRYLSDSREEELVEVGVNLADGRILRRLDEAIERYGLSPVPWEPFPMAEELPVAQTYGIARGELESRILSTLGSRRRQLELRSERESERAAAYYSESLRELQEERGGLAPDDPGRPRLDAKARAIRIEQDGRLAEIRSKYRLEAQVALLSVLRLYQPKLVFRGRLVGKSHAAEITLLWDPVESKGEPIPCSLCGGLTYELGAGRSGAAACPPCLERAAARPALSRSAPHGYNGRKGGGQAWPARRESK